MNAAQIIKDAAESLDGVSIRTDYSGRCMFGKQCIGIVGDPSDCKQVISDCIYELFEMVDSEEISVCDAQEIAGEIMDYQEDGMGLQVIFYWTKLKAE